MNPNLLGTCFAWNNIVAAVNMVCLEHELQIECDKEIIKDMHFSSCLHTLTMSS